MTNTTCIRVLLALVFFHCINGMKAEEAAKPTGTVHYQPAGSIFGDPIPFYHDGVHHVFYLKSGSWYHLVSRDLVAWQELGPAIAPDENDRSIATGSIVEKDGAFHAFYTTASRKDKRRLNGTAELPPISPRSGQTGRSTASARTPCPARSR
jgi:sucrose-6-phosphate hydrolase SacC (GH32 family)